MGLLQTLRKPVLLKKQQLTVPQVQSSISEGSVSSSSTFESGTLSTPTSSSPSTSAFSNRSAVFQETPAEVYRALKPILTLLENQSSKLYYEWPSDEKQVDENWTININDQIKPVKKLKLANNELIFELNDGKKLQLPLIDHDSSMGTFKYESNYIVFLTSPSVTLVCDNINYVSTLKRLISLSIFEHFSLFKSATGTFLSTVGLHIPDMHVVLNSEFNFKDWCEIYVEGQGWIRAWCHINRKRSSKFGLSSPQKNERKGKYQIKFYKDNKSTSPSSQSNLICYIPDSNNVEDVFFYNLRSSLLEPTNFVDNTNHIKLLGEIFFNQECNLNDISSRKSFSPKRSVSTASIKSSSSSSQNKSSFKVNKKGLLIRPIPHNGISHIETFIRFIIPIFDVTRKYGRPNHFKSSRNDMDSLMFGLPKLPHLDYFQHEDIKTLLSREYCYTGGEDLLSFSMNWCKNALNEYIN
ncbi:hypothetical protein KAFR_0J00560 [Kazachstania africana CBS 2517]|uniref:Skg3/CAF120-like PH-like domain-containing protein n=1 Tax=Kazachstania africana (strain ATCC 22294 / BCRC 22015 / CBS 2517 / CECT 1963 / NBRC 1671 / NRRL Y-8276) TaxID=1071382 RepID=H2B0H4_KAZAF|nr:hypothetical protein KAFR_0J00560 [Kazachstania africana CBS 2517]CCF60124.1 hypothetical protein KAFR_0J00560 [Kazachstania africana CBS 2517]